MKRVAALDLGTNTFLCLVADVRGGEVVRVVSDQAKVVRLGQGVHQAREFHPDALARADACLSEFAREIQNQGAQKIIAGATSAARDARNVQALFDLGRKHGIQIDILSGSQEAEGTYWGAVGRSQRGGVALIDVGGGSTEFIVGDENGIQMRTSLDIGAVRLTEMFVSRHPIAKVELERMASYIEEKTFSIKELALPERVSRVIAVAGTPTALAALESGRPFEAERVHGSFLSREILQKWQERLAAMTVSERSALPGLDPGRADVIVAGTMILLMGAAAIGADVLEVSVRGLRYGLALNAGEIE